MPAEPLYFHFLPGSYAAKVQAPSGWENGREGGSSQFEKLRSLVSRVPRKLARGACPGPPEARSLDTGNGKLRQNQEHPQRSLQLLKSAAIARKGLSRPGIPRLSQYLFGVTESDLRAMIAN